MSNLRLIGLLFGISGIILSFLYFRGKNWHRFNFVLSFTFCLAVALVSLNPEFVNFLRRFLSFDQAEFGRLLGLLVTGVLFLFGIVFYLKSRHDDLRYQFDLLVRGLGLEKVENMASIAARMKPVMILIPAYNEAENLQVLLPRLPGKIGELEVGVVVIDDGSEDATSEVAEAQGCIVLKNIINRGQGGSLRLGYDLLAQYDVRIGLTMDADNQHRPEDIEPMVRPILDDEADLVVGSRILGSREKGSRLRHTGVYVFSYLMSLVTGVRLTDCSNGFKAFRMDRMKELELKEEQFQAAEVLLVAVKKHLRVSEVPIVVQNRHEGESKKGTNLVYGLMFLKTIIKAWWR